MDISSIDTRSKTIAGLRIAVLAISCVCAAAGRSFSYGITGSKT
jgi:hypothetical protein